VVESHRNTAKALAERLDAENVNEHQSEVKKGINGALAGWYSG